MVAMSDTATPHGMSALFVGGDWASAHNELGSLAHVAEQLAVCVAEPFHRELIELAQLCHDDSDAAGRRWLEVRERLRHALAHGNPGEPPSVAPHE
jgi:hypothetical protein